jgi:uncharacterized tellurite resistance protein B-like protein
MNRTDQILICQLVAGLLIVDAAVTSDEHQYLTVLFERFGFDADERQSVYDGVNVDQDVAAMARRIDSAAHEALRGALHDAANADGVFGRGEIDMIERVRAALGVDGSCASPGDPPTPAA